MNRLIWLVSVFALIAGCSKSPEEIRQDLWKQGRRQLAEFKFDQATVTFEQLGTDFPNLADGQFGLGLVLEAQLLYHDAMRSYLTTLESNPSFAPARTAVARVYGHLNRFESAAREYEGAASQPGCDFPTHGRLIRSLITIRDIDDAQRALTRALSMGLDGPYATVLEAQLQYHRQAFDSSIASVTLALSHPAEQAEFYWQLANYYEDRGLIDSAIEFSRKSILADDVGFEHYQEHFSRCLHYEYYYEARRLMKLAAERDERKSLFSGLQLHFAWSTDDSRLASTSGIEYSRINADKFTPLIYDARTRWMTSDAIACGDNLEMARGLLLQTGTSKSFSDFLRGEIELTAMIMDDPPPETGERIRSTREWVAGERAFRLADAYLTYRMGQLDQFKGTLDSLFEQHNDEVLWLTGMGDLCARKLVGLYEDADQYYRRALETDPFYHPALTNWIGMYDRRNMLDRIELIQSEFEDLFQSRPELLLRKARLLVRTGEIDAGLELFKKNIIPVRGNLNHYEDFVHLLETNGGATQALELSSLAPEHSPDNADAYEFAARVLVDHDEYDRALTTARAGLAIEPGFVRLRAQEARALYMSGERDEAVEIFDELLKAPEGNTDVNIFYSQCVATTSMEERRVSNMARSAVFQSGGSLASLNNLCFVYYQYQQFKALRGEGRRTTRSYPFSPDAYFYLGIAQKELKDGDAKINLQKAIDLGLWGWKLHEARKILDKL